MLAILFIFLLSTFNVVARKKADAPNNRYMVSLVTVTNPANAPFYYHTALEMAIETKSLEHHNESSFDRDSYGIYPDLTKKGGWLFRIWKFVRPLWSCNPRVRSPDPLYEGLGSKVKVPKGRVIYKETREVTREQYEVLKDKVENWNTPYSYLGWFGTDNCSSWVRRLLNAIPPADAEEGTEVVTEGICCNRYYFHLPEFMGGKVLRLPVLPFDFPKFCHSKEHMADHFRLVYSKQGGTVIR